MSLKSQPEIDELVRYTRWYGGMKTECDAWIWLNENIPNWMRKHDTKITYEYRLGGD